MGNNVLTKNKENRTNNTVQCKSIFSMIKGEIHRCSLFDGHSDNHMFILEWTEEESD